MNVEMSRSQFETVMSLYLIEMSKRTKKDESLAESTDIFNDLLEHVNKQPLTGLQTSYNEADAETKLYYRRFLDELINKGFIRIMI